MPSISSEGITPSYQPEELSKSSAAVNVTKVVMPPSKGVKALTQLYNAKIQESSLSATKAKLQGTAVATTAAASQLAKSSAAAPTAAPTISADERHSNEFSQNLDYYYDNSNEPSFKNEALRLAAMNEKEGILFDTFLKPDQITDRKAFDEAMAKDGAALKNAIGKEVFRLAVNDKGELLKTFLDKIASINEKLLPTVKPDGNLHNYVASL